MSRRLLRIGVRVYRAIDDTPPWAWIVVGALAGTAFLKFIR